MKLPPFLPAPFLLLMAACATPSEPIVRTAQIGEAIESAAAQIRRCYRDPIASGASRRISTRLRVRYAPDGTLIGLPRLVSQEGITPANLPYAARMAEAASIAVIRCSPLHLRPELYRGGWDEFDLVFSRFARV